MQDDRAPEHSAVFLENALPNPVADQGERGAAHFVFFLGEGAAEFR